MKKILIAILLVFGFLVTFGCQPSEPENTAVPTEPVPISSPTEEEMLPTQTEVPTDTPEPETVSGQVTKLDRQALPEDALVKVQLVDISLADAPAQVLGEQIIESAGAQVPFDYEITYEPVQIVDNHTYAVQARIENAEGVLLYINTQEYLVITRGNPTENVEVLVEPVSLSMQIEGDPAEYFGEPDFFDRLETGSNWTTFDNVCFTSEIEGGQYIMTGKLNINCWEVTWPEIEDFYMEVTVETTDTCPEGAGFGLFFKAPNSLEGYLFNLLCNGRYTFGTWDANTKTGTQIIPLAESPDSLPGPNQRNRIGVLVNGNTFAFYINGEFQQEAEDDTYPDAGRFGHTVRAGTGDELITVKFDNLAYWLLPEGGQVGPAPTSPVRTPTRFPDDPVLSLGDPDWRDGFNNADNWTEFDDSCFKSEIVDGKFEFTGKRNVTCWEVSHPRIEDFYLEVTAEITEQCPDNGSYGLIYRAPTSESGYIFRLTCEGNYTLIGWNAAVGDGATFIRETSSEQVNVGTGEFNRIGVLVDGALHTLYINGVEVAQAEEDTYVGEGFFGLVIRGGLGNTPTVVNYDDIQYWTLP